MVEPSNCRARQWCAQSHSMSAIAPGWRTFPATVPFRLSEARRTIFEHGPLSRPHQSSSSSQSDGLDKSVFQHPAVTTNTRIARVSAHGLLYGANFAPMEDANGSRGRNHKTEYRRRIARAAAKGLSRSQARGHPKPSEGRLVKTSAAADRRRAAAARVQSAAAGKEP